MSAASAPTADRPLLTTHHAPRTTHHAPLTTHHALPYYLLRFRRMVEWLRHAAMEPRPRQEPLPGRIALPVRRLHSKYRHCKYSHGECSRGEHSPAHLLPTAPHTATLCRRCATHMPATLCRILQPTCRRCATPSGSTSLTQTLTLNPTPTPTQVRHPQRLHLLLRRALAPLVLALLLLPNGG